MNLRHKIAILVLLSLLSTLSGSSSALAQEPHPPFTPYVANTSNGPQQAPNGIWYMQAGKASEMQGLIQLNNGGPDGFGYTWDDTGAVSWIDATSGTDTGMTGGFAKGVGPISMPFNFKYYENSYSTIYISQYGYVAFTAPTSWEWQSQIPSTESPNNVIAPYWTPTYISTNGWVRYLSGGTAPNRYFVVEWHNLQGDTPGNPGGDALYRFELILHENGDIVFQYQTMNLGSLYACGSAGIEDSAGLDGLTYIDFCKEPPALNKAVRFYRPLASARVNITPPNEARLTRFGALESFQLQVRNTGEFGNDTYDLTTSSIWPVSLYKVDGVTPLSDTDNDGIADTGPVVQGGMVTIIAKIQTPVHPGIGEENTALIALTSSVNPSVSKSAPLQAIIPAPFAEVYVNASSNVMALDLVRPDSHVTIATASFDLHTYDTVIAGQPNGNFIYLWTNQHAAGPYWIDEIYYTILNAAGGTVRAPVKLADLTGAATHVYDYRSGVAVAPNGKIGILWVRKYYQSSTDKTNENLYFAQLDAAGNLVTGPINLTNNNIWGAYTGDDNEPYFFTPRIVATDDSHFILAWNQEHKVPKGGWIDDIYYAVRDENGNQVQPATALTTDTQGSWGTDGYFLPALSALNSNRAALTWSTFRSMDDDIFYAILGSDGSIVKSATNLSVDETVIDARNGDVVQLSDGTIVAAWEAFGCFPGALVPRIRYALLDTDYNPVGSPQCLDKSPALAGDNHIALTTDSMAHAILTWTDADLDAQKDMYYALLDNTGNVLTSPVLLGHSQQASAPMFIDTSISGNDSAPYGSENFADIALGHWARSWINRLYAAGITGGCGAAPLTYCPDTSVTRSQMAVFLERGMNGAAFTPPNASGTIFGDVPANYWAAAWIEKLMQDGITGGCGSGNYCPEIAVTRAQMAVFLLRAMHGSVYEPPAATGVFTDVPTTHWAAAWIEQLAAEGITSGCGGGNYCPDTPVTRAQMAVFLVRAFNLP
ncbi:MAG: S-layer homology domain-containing protein [Chloroflexi bacterium]|nr:S-layer homology domain-containing protein [Chloroflexota bacterium]